MCALLYVVVSSDVSGIHAGRGLLSRTYKGASLHGSEESGLGFNYVLGLQKNEFFFVLVRVVVSKYDGPVAVVRRLLPPILGNHWCPLRATRLSCLVVSQSARTCRSSEPYGDRRAVAALHKFAARSTCTNCCGSNILCWGDHPRTFCGRRWEGACVPGTV